MSTWVGPNALRRPGWSGPSWRDWRKTPDIDVFWDDCWYCSGQRRLLDSYTHRWIDPCPRCLGVGQLPRLTRPAGM